METNQYTQTESEENLQDEGNSFDVNYFDMKTLDSFQANVSRVNRNAILHLTCLPSLCGEIWPLTRTATIRMKATRHQVTGHIKQTGKGRSQENRRINGCDPVLSSLYCCTADEIFWETLFMFTAK